MTETVTSKLTRQYFSRILTFIGFWVFLIVLCENANLDKHETRVAEIYASLFWLVLIVLIFFIFPPKKIVVSNENITIKNYITGKQIVIAYTDIERTAIIAAAPNVRGRGDAQFRRFEITLKNKIVISFNPADYDNFNALKAAIYDHTLRGL